MSDKDTQAAIDSAIQKAVDAFTQIVDQKLGAAIDLGTKIGAEAAAETAAKATAKALEKQKRQYAEKLVDRRYHNTKLLLRNYRKLNSHYKEAVKDKLAAVEESDSFMEIMELMTGTLTDEQLLIESIERSAVRTQVIMAHVNKMLDIYKEVCDRSQRPEDGRHWRALRALYLDDEPMTAAEIAELEQVDKRTVYKDIDASVRDLTVLFFGIDGVLIH